jgi:acyl-[acyl-carrier-protein]-phospholipid O-acyltransferase/long-chain-fatty-acid--[acyl-carrier-protein] ligase
MKRFTGDNEHVGVLLPNVPVTVELVLGLSAAGRVPVMFNYSAGVTGVKVARSVAGVCTVITSRKFIEHARLQPLLEALSDCTIVYLEDLRNQFRLSDKLWLLAFALHFPRRAFTRCSVLDPAVVLLTSGSDGEPKGVVLSHRAIIANVMQIRTVMDFTPADKILNPLPLYHAYSFTAGMVLPLITGTRLHLYISPLHYRAIPEIAYRNDCTVLFGTGACLDRKIRPANFRRLRLYRVRSRNLACHTFKLPRRNGWPFFARDCASHRAGKGNRQRRHSASARPEPDAWSLSSGRARRAAPLLFRDRERMVRHGGYRRNGRGGLHRRARPRETIRQDRR